jgi:hypothetical protein
MRIEMSRSKMAVGTLMGLGLMVGIYAAAASAASSLASNYVTTESASHRPNFDFAASAQLGMSPNAPTWLRSAPKLHEAMTSNQRTTK